MANKRILEYNYEQQHNEILKHTVNKTFKERKEQWLFTGKHNKNLINKDISKSSAKDICKI